MGRFILKRKTFSIWSALRAGMDEYFKNDPDFKKAGQYEEKTNPILGILKIDWCIDKSRYIGKNWKYTVEKDYTVKAKQGNSCIDWNLEHKFEPIDVPPFKVFNIEGVAKEGDYLPARIITATGKLIEGRVLVQIEGM